LFYFLKKREELIFYIIKKIIMEKKEGDIYILIFLYYSLLEVDGRGGV